MDHAQRHAHRLSHHSCCLRLLPSRDWLLHPNPRLSIMRTGNAHDLYIWDSTPTGFMSDDLTALVASTDPNAKLTAIEAASLAPA